MATKSAQNDLDIDDRPFIEANSDARSRYGRFNLAIIGGTGVGKSSLVNAVFGKEIAKVGKGMPVTRDVDYYYDNKSLGLWDFEGFEIGSAKSPAESLRANLKTISERPAEEQIAVVWYCVLAKADRLTQTDIDLIRELDAAGLPVVLVLTKVDWTKNALTGRYKAPNDVEKFRDWLEKPDDADKKPITIPIQRVILTAAVGSQGKGAGHGLGELVAETLTLSPENEKDAFRIAQKLNLPWKREMARPVIAIAASAAAASAAVPILVADAIALAPIQMAMMARIAVIYDLEMKSMLSGSALAQLGSQIVGKALARSFIKLIPGAGNVVNGAVAFALTAATGEGWLRLSERIHTGDVDVSQVNEVWRDYSPTLASIIKKMVEARGSRNSVGS
ncbi:GTPase [Cryobacterium sp. Hb1]|uniref:GTPase n=1 Tax=Cryobacterium sp. Hb1 TaxID=1259147 RepID=UPI00106C0202|nr:GTPase [Cryobacterium sp. Hb1]TFD63739.1 GTPase [Cryobacterium sp. Hb1]